MSVSKRKNSKTVLMIGSLGLALMAALEKSNEVLHTVELPKEEKPVIVNGFESGRFSGSHPNRANTPKFRWPLDMPSARPRIQAQAFDVGRIDGEASGIVLPASDVQAAHPDWLGEEVVCYLNGARDGVASRV